MNITDHVFEETHIAGQSRCVAETLPSVDTKWEVFQQPASPNLRGKEI